MKRQINNKYQGTKFKAVKHPGTVDSAGKDSKKHLPPLRDQKRIDTRLLCSLINKRTNNFAELVPSGIKINQIKIKITDGLAVADQVQFRYADLWELLLNLKKEKILFVEFEDMRTIKTQYFKT